MVHHQLALDKGLAPLRSGSPRTMPLWSMGVLESGPRGANQSRKTVFTLLDGGEAQGQSVLTGNRQPLPARPSRRASLSDHLAKAFPCRPNHFNFTYFEAPTT